jgi:hypothetical protein
MDTRVRTRHDVGAVLHATSDISVTAGVIRRAGTVLVCQRAPGGHHPGKWFSKGGWRITVAGTSYSGDWRGALFVKPDERRLYL